jgi:Na+-translocating ferredoxin:NAD+ oxidoreductase subunit E
MTDNKEKKFTLKDFTNNIFENNAIFVQILGMCPVLAITTSIVNGFGMGMAVLGVLLFSNLTVSMVREVIPNKIRIPSFIVIIATFVTITDLVMKGFFPALSKSLGIFIPLIVANCIVLARAEAFASKRSIFASTLDALGTGIGYTLALMFLGGIRELLGTGKIIIMDTVLVNTGMPINYMILAPGAFLAFGLALGFFKYLSLRKQERAKVE